MLMTGCSSAYSMMAKVEAYRACKCEFAATIKIGWPIKFTDTSASKGSSCAFGETSFPNGRSFESIISTTPGASLTAERSIDFI